MPRKKQDPDEKARADAMARSRMMSDLPSANARIRELEAAIAKLAADREELLALLDRGMQLVDDSTVKTSEGLRKLLRSVVAEADFVLRGGDNPCERCSECGLAGVGMLRDALKPARTALEGDGS